ncbi:lysophospholipid acyltransferase family protein [Roseiconus lacunae]|uniref:Lysophospholipid acyltransferase family protein n=1 Tax=Roseiconus lacunae TaxID=2605694 RepID=A0ABT7PLG0_9BACT|nr:lysophospholipid acyltransferase family protein [Roseiconus lacunae]MCD0460892.1 lysophospholipid acyltransferase family protein [Roseiconus lacunae]MDM4017352.1 lysophospholipid acyltransferase family protein [Roseiconus lacunae]WRQ48736.1 lysophospholipid acyltransferase family protein [Stieleria sp. HD01]
MIRPFIQTASHFFAYIFVRLFVAFVQTMPLDMGDSMCRGLAWFAARVFRIRHRTTANNLAQVFPDATRSERRALELAMWHSLLLMVCEIAWAGRRLHLTNWTEYVRFRNQRDILRACLSRRPVVMVSGHFGNFEIGGYTAGLMGCEATTIARTLDNPYLHRWVERFRSAKGQRLLDKDGCAVEVDQHLSAGGMLAILADQHAGPKGCWERFLGVHASCHKALPLFSLGSGAPMLAGFTKRLDHQPMKFESGSLGVADPEDDPEGHCETVHTLTRWYNRRLAESVGEAVEQYWWLHRRWRTPPPRVAKRLAKLAKAA